MVENITNLQIISFMYNEMTAREQAEMKQKISKNTHLSSDYDMLKTSQQALPKVLFNPSNSVIDRILKLSREAAAEPQY